ncbi:hypothetical protein [Paraburkholderia sp. RL17-337-BIB-A]|uniref:hypothetical protein n=1 Tax=Paraburkholderia sp. RL17-337-BIB-A TaxID=3031636 RepID=UPI0038BB093E
MAVSTQLSAALERPLRAPRRRCETLTAAFGVHDKFISLKPYNRQIDNNVAVSGGISVLIVAISNQVEGWALL